MVPVPVHGGDVGAGDHVHRLLEPVSSLSEWFRGEKLHHHNGQRVKEEEDSEGDQGPLRTQCSVNAVFGSCRVEGDVITPPLTLDSVDENN